MEWIFCEWIVELWSRDSLHGTVVHDQSPIRRFSCPIDVQT